MRVATLIFLLMFAACLGPDAPDSAVCRDYIDRICIAPVCSAVVPLYPVGSSCETTLKIKSGCLRDDFAFTTPTRDRFLSCRLAVVRAGLARQTHPNCEDVAEAFDRCPDVVRMMQGIP